MPFGYELNARREATRVAHQLLPTHQLKPVGINEEALRLLAFRKFMLSPASFAHKFLKDGQ